VAVTQQGLFLWGCSWNHSDLIDGSGVTCAMQSNNTKAD